MLYVATGVVLVFILGFVFSRPINGLLSRINVTGSFRIPESFSVWLFGDKSFPSVERLASIAGLGAFGLAVYTILVPETLSGYLERVAAASEATSDNTSRTADNTQLLADSVSTWLSVGAFQYSTNGFLSGIIMNGTDNSRFRNVLVTVLHDDKVWTSDLGVMTPGDVRELRLSGVKIITRICLQAINDSTGQSVSEVLTPNQPDISDLSIQKTVDLSLRKRDIQHGSTIKPCEP